MNKLILWHFCQRICFSRLLQLFEVVSRENSRFKKQQQEKSLDYGAVLLFQLIYTNLYIKMLIYLNLLVRKNIFIQNRGE
jgi:hypothetical protein